MFRLFWCLLLTALPIVFLLINADPNILKSFPVLIIVLIMPVFFVAAVKTLQYLNQNYGRIMAHQREQDKRLGLEDEETVMAAPQTA
ncbi:hypothetical protein GCM10023116_26520 [Kistimonas scapharcae]|uniref:Uncharacterized protein n=1 Tax=Kistimonas scapharcae TaxID=1036133 RepID=A0ABP8V4N9_9GAMM